MRFEKEFERFENILKTDNLQKKCLEKYRGYVETIVKFKNSVEELASIYEQYKDEIIKMILSSDELKDKIFIDENRNIRHDKDFNQEIDLEKITKNIFQGPDNLNYFEDSTRIVILLETAKLMTFYGLDELVKNHDSISKEIRLGIFSAKSDKYVSESELKVIEQRVEIDEIYGEEAIPYIENYNLLKQRVEELREYTKIPEEMEKIDFLIEQLKEIDSMLEQKDNKVIPVLKQSFSDYERINREMIISRINTNEKEVINNPNDEYLLLLHFIPDFEDDNDHDKDSYFEEALEKYIQNYIKEKYGREYDPELDKEEASEIMWQYWDSKKNPFDLKSRIPLKNRYMNNSFYEVITKPYTDLSCSIGKAGDLHPHLKRRIAFGISNVPVNAIKSINTGYNNELDRFSFEKNSASLPEVLRYIEKGGTNETLIDWTQVEFSYILVIKDTAELSEEVLKEAEEYSKDSGLPIRIYDSYEIEKIKSNPDLWGKNKEIPGAYDVKDLSAFAKYESRSNSDMQIQNMIENSKLGGTKDEQSK